ncbi:hypothetical protein ARMSODRAFT_980695 [Armillaria solidipes]|uniref:Uncharacterized protein n=1 Tax=Armillaria solidipes TaxID=1076256 RepID=A0A2H3AUI1_9AGAR|nr:hypothetical protein ARMSODRAFT_980695 [Armillaria solidipes]
MSIETQYPVNEGRILLSEMYSLLTAGYGAAKGSPLVWSMPYSCPEFLTTRKDLQTWFSSRATGTSQGDPVMVFGRDIAKVLQCFANEIWSNGSEHSHKSIDDMVGSPEEARVLDMLVLFKAMDVACTFSHPTPARPHHPSYNAMNLSQEELVALEPLRTWCQKLSKIPKQCPVLPSTSFPAEGALLAAMHSRRWVGTWEKITGLLNFLGVYIRFILYHHGMQHTSQREEDRGMDPRWRWKQYIRRTINDEEYLDQLESDFPHVKKVFALAVTMSPLFIIIGDTCPVPYRSEDESLPSGNQPCYFTLKGYCGASPRRGDFSILAHMLEDESNMVERGWFLGEWFSDVVLMIQETRVLGSEARIAEVTQFWLDWSRSRLGEISCHEEVPVERGRRRSCPPRGVSRLRPRRCHSVSPEPSSRAKTISVAVLPVMDVNQLTKNTVPDILGGWPSLPLIDQTFLGSGGQDNFRHLSQRKRARSVTDITRSGAKKAKMDARVSYFVWEVVLPEVWDPLMDSKVKFTYSALRSNCIDRSNVRNWNDCFNSPSRRESMIKLINFKDALDDPSNTLSIFAKSNIHLFETPASPLDWSLATLSDVGDIDKVHHLGGHQRSREPHMTVDISLRDMYAGGVQGDRGVVNFISLSGSDRSNSHPLQSHLCAFDKTSDVPGISSDVYPHSVTSFWFVATKGAATSVATDSFGVGTAIEMLCGCQMWYLFQRRETGDRDVPIDWEAKPAEDDVGNDWEPGFIPDPKYWTAEVVLLKPGSALGSYMRPDTHHAVVTLENSIIKGHHFYSTVTLSKTVSGWVHTRMFGDIGGLPIAHLQRVLLRIMIYFGKILKEGTNSVDFHFPKLNKTGLMNLIALGNWCLFLDAFNSRDFEQNDATVLAIVRRMAISDFARASAVHFALRIISDAKAHGESLEFSAMRCLERYLKFDTKAIKVREVGELQLTRNFVVIDNSAEIDNFWFSRVLYNASLNIGKLPTYSSRSRSLICVALGCTLYLPYNLERSSRPMPLSRNVRSSRIAVRDVYVDIIGTRGKRTHYPVNAGSSYGAAKGSPLVEAKPPDRLPGCRGTPKYEYGCKDVWLISTGIRRLVQNWFDGILREQWHPRTGVILV